MFIVVVCCLALQYCSHAATLAENVKCGMAAPPKSYYINLLSIVEMHKALLHNQALM